jgi:outer membrane lipoprotein-sorting protein
MKIIIKTVLMMFMSVGVFAQSADEIIANYFEAIGGIENFKAIKGMKISAKVNQGGVDIPLEIVSLSDGRQYTKISLQGMELMQGVFDGESVWNTNFQSMTPEKSDAEASANQKLDANDFPSEFIDYKAKGYTLELVGKETMDGSETFKLKLTKEPKTVDGQSVEDVTYYFFDAEAFIPLAQESTMTQGPAKGQTMQIKFSDYQEVDGMYFPFSMSQGVKGGGAQTISFDSVELNPEISDDAFKFPESKEGDD